LIAAMQRGNSAQRGVVRTAIETGDVAMINQVVEIVKATGALDVARRAAGAEAQRAIAAASRLPDGPHTACLLQLAAELLGRQS